MNTRQAIRWALVLAAAATSGAFAQTTPAAEAAAMPIVGRSIDPNTFIVGHPASPRWVHRHAGAEHPAVQVARAARADIDPNTFLVQPPAPVHWVVRGDTPLRVAQATR